jgi:hypothetical protein
MKSISYYDSSYSPNEMGEAYDVPCCLECGDEGFVRHGVFNELKKVCECSEAPACYFCETPMDLENNPYRDNVCHDCALTEFGE